MVGILKRAWIPLLIEVVALAGVVVYRVHGFFGSNNETPRPGAGLAEDTEPFHPKVVTRGADGPMALVAARRPDDPPE